MNISSKWDSICNSKDYDKNKCSKYLKYWLYGKIAEKKLKFFLIRKLNENLKELIEGKLSIIDEKDCTRNFIECAAIEVLHNKKILYDFLEYYIYLNDEMAKIEENAKGEYCKYITYIFELYHKLYEEDRQWGLLHRYENELKLFSTTFTNENALSSLKSKCNIDNLLIKSLKDVKTTDMLEGNQLRRPAISDSHDNRFTNIKSEYENVIKELPSSKIYNDFDKKVSTDAYNSKHCGNLNVDKDQMKDICKNMERNIRTLPDNSQMNGLSHRDRCTYLNFWIYDEISKLYTNRDGNLTNITEVANLIDANIKINMDLIKDNFNTNNNTDPTKFVKYYDLSKYNTCFFNYDCTFSECREMKHLFEFFKNYDEINKKIDCEKRNKGKYYKYLKYISYLYNKHKYEEECCSGGAEICPDYFLSCDDYYDPNKLLSAIDSDDIPTCNKIKDPSLYNLSEETTTINPEEENNMYIKYFTCSYVTDPKFEKKRLRCQHPVFSAHLNDKLSARRSVIKRQNNNLKGKKLTINGKNHKCCFNI
ncbi:CYIR protein [Plasmodium cynomolgi strain B]|uniref:CYIR protein n=1 Tax=Plasmodium cynomolgi (strain B) TaxID=1120755 RepID=K6VJE4_PLACD|nr:CYIR protein [Plasmodium cynomolgi strain B]GAB69512.1 CYIR protein [Plasmodium cynomolgi strain B]